VNQKAWNQFESYCRDLVRRGNRLYVISGPQGRGGRGTNGPREMIAGTKVTVPARCWKVVVVVPSGGGSGGGEDLARVTPATRVIAIDMPNDNDAVGEAWAPFRTTPAAIESQTGYRFFDRLPADVADALRQRLDKAPIAAPGPINRGGD
jgi:endonuclease G